MGHDINEDGELELRISWKGYSPDDNSWVAVENGIYGFCLENLDFDILTHNQELLCNDKYFPKC